MEQAWWWRRRKSVLDPLARWRLLLLTWLKRLLLPWLKIAWSSRSLSPWWDKGRHLEDVRAQFPDVRWDEIDHIFVSGDVIAQHVINEGIKSDSVSTTNEFGLRNGPVDELEGNGPLLCVAPGCLGGVPLLQPDCKIGGCSR